MSYKLSLHAIFSSLPQQWHSVKKVWGLQALRVNSCRSPSICQQRALCNLCQSPGSRNYISGKLSNAAQVFNPLTPPPFNSQTVHYMQRQSSHCLKQCISHLLSLLLSHSTLDHAYYRIMNSWTTSHMDNTQLISSFVHSFIVKAHDKWARMIMTQQWRIKICAWTEQWKHKGKL